MRARRLLAVRACAALTACVAVLAGCGLPTMKAAAPIDAGAVPSRAPLGSTSDGTAATADTTELFFVFGDNMLRGVRRAPVVGNEHQVVDLLLDQLVAGPDDVERQNSLSSAIPPGLTLKLARLVDGEAVVDLEGSDPGPGGESAHLATGQVVLTLTALPGISTVRLTRNGRPLEAALPDGSLTALPLTRLDFTTLVR